MNKQVAALIALAIVFLSSAVVREGSVVDELADPHTAADTVAALSEETSFGHEAESTTAGDLSGAPTNGSGGWSDIGDDANPVDTFEGFDPTPASDENGENVAMDERDPAAAPSIPRATTASDGVKIIYTN